MKKIALSLAGALAATAFAPEAAAVPAFARQTGMACTACHAQHFPVLNAFGRSFKASGYTMMGSQGKVEADHMSLPDTLNASIVMKLRYREDNRTGTAGADANNTLGDGNWEVFDELALFLGGRVAENVGFAMEGQMNGTAAFAAGMKLHFAYDVGGAKLSVIPFTTDAMGPAMGYELGSGGVYRPVRWSESRATTSAVQYNQVGPATAVPVAPLTARDTAGNTVITVDGGARNGGVGGATGIAFAAQNDMGYIAYTQYNPSYQLGGGAGNAANDMDSRYVRIAATPTFGGWAMQIGAGKMSGASKRTIDGVNTAGTAVTGAMATLVEPDQTFFDFEAHGEVGGKELSMYLQHAKAPVVLNAAGLNMNPYNPDGVAGTPDRKATTIGVDYSIIPNNVLSIGAAYRTADNGKAANVNGDDAWTVQAVYELYQNVALHAYYVDYSGSARNKAANNRTATNETAFMLEAAW